MKNKHSVYLLDFWGNLNIFGVFIGIMFLFPLVYFQIVDLIKDFDINNFLVCLILCSLIFVALYAVFKLRNYEESVEKIIVTDDYVIVILYTDNKKQKLMLNKSDIVKFHINFDASIFGSFGDRRRSINYHMSFDIQTSSGEKCHRIWYSFQSKGIIKSIFKIAKYIPNFSFSIDNECIPVIAESIKKIAVKGKDLNLIEFLKYMLTSPFVSKMAKLETCFWMIVLPLLAIFIFLAIFNEEICYKILPYTGVCFINIIGPLIIIMIILSFFFKEKK